jgi:hypothetical protein
MEIGGDAGETRGALAALGMTIKNKREVRSLRSG